MAGAEMLVISGNPRRRRRKKARGHRRAKATRRRRRRAVASNPIRRIGRRRRRRVGARRARASRRRRHMNPRLPLIGKVNVPAIGAATGGFLATRYGAPMLTGLLPAAWTASIDPNIVRIGGKAVVGFVVLPMIAKLLKLRGVAGPLAIGAGVAVALDAFDTWIKPMVPGLSDYENQVLTDYEMRSLTGTATAYGAGSLNSSGNIYGGGGAYSGQY